MRRAAIYSSTRAEAPVPVVPATAPAAAAATEAKPGRWRELARRHGRRLRIAAAALGVLAVAALAWTYGPELRGMSPAEVDAAIQRALEAVPPRPSAADAVEKITPSLVHVRAFAEEEEKPAEAKGEAKGEVKAESKPEAKNET